MNSQNDDQLLDRLLNERILLLGTEVDDAVANRLCGQLLLLSAEDPEGEIGLYINSPGGSVTAGLAIYDTMSLIPNDVATLGMGLVASMGQFLLTAGTPGKRSLLPHSRVLLHQGSAGLSGTAVDIAIQADNLQQLNLLMTRLTAEHTGQSEDVINADSLRDNWFDAERAVAYGLADRVLRTVSGVGPRNSRPAPIRIGA